MIGPAVRVAPQPNASIKFEYLHMDFGTYNGFSANREDFSFNDKIDLVRAGVNYKISSGARRVARKSKGVGLCLKAWG